MPISISSFVPQMLTRRFKTRREPLQRSESERLPGILLFVDITGSTSLIEQMSKLASADGDGAETMARLMNTCFTPMMEMIVDSGGDVVKFAGDGLMALWRYNERAPHPCFVRAAHCALRCQALAGRLQENGVVLKLRVCLTVGELLVAHLGGIQNRWELLVAGLPLRQLHDCLPRCEPGRVVFSREAYLPLARYVEASPVLPSPVGQECYHIQRVLVPEPPLLSPQRSNALEEWVNPDHSGAVLSLHTSALSAYLPRSLLYQLDQESLPWIAERRQISMVFVSLPGLEQLAEYQLDRAQEIMQTCQRCIYREEGSIIRLNEDDKGVVLMCAFGLSPFAHSDDPLRAVMASLSIQRELERVGQSCSIGVATGRVFAGHVGGSRRAEYALVGDCVNLAARLTCEPDTLLCDEVTFRATTPIVDYETLQPIRVKGKREPVPIFVPTWVTEYRGQQSHYATPEGAVPDGLVLGWVDKLPAAHRLLLRVASFLEGAFSAELLRGLQPVVALGINVEDALEQLRQKGILVLNSSANEPTYSFKSERISRVMAGTLSQAQQQLLRKCLWEREQSRSGRASFI